MDPMIEALKRKQEPNRATDRAPEPGEDSAGHAPTHGDQGDDHVYAELIKKLKENPDALKAVQKLLGTGEHADHEDSDGGDEDPIGNDSLSPDDEADMRSMDKEVVGNMSDPEKEAINAKSTMSLGERAKKAALGRMK